jgi:phytoene dehydrogenase-like protein
MTRDYLVLGSGLSALSFSALMAKSGFRVTVLEAHEFAGGFGHTFSEGSPDDPYHFNAQLHYVWDCGENEPVQRILKKLDLDKQVPFVRYNEQGFDRMRLPNGSLDIPNDYALLTERLCAAVGRDAHKISHFLRTIEALAKECNRFSPPSNKNPLLHYLRRAKSLKLLKFYGKTLQQVFDYFELPRVAQSLLASQWPDFLLPPKELSFYCWLVLFDGYMRGAYYPRHHFESVVNGLVECIRTHGGEVHFNQKVIDIEINAHKVSSVRTECVSNPQEQEIFQAKNFICNFDPKQAVNLIGVQHFSKRVRQQVSYDYSPSNFVAYCAVKDLDLREYGFGNWNLFHSEQEDLNQVFDDMYRKHDYSKPAFAITTPSLVTDDQTGCPKGEQLFQLLTVANYERFKDIKLRNQRQYIQAKKHIFNSILDVIEKRYVPNIREAMSFKMLGSPTTNESYCWAPEGHSYGSNMTPRNTGLSRLGHDTSIENFYFCSASAGFAGFTKSLQTGAALYEKLSGDLVPAYV